MVLPAWVFWVSLVAMLIGLAGVVLPVLPGVALIWLVIIIYALVERFATIGPVAFILLSILGVIVLLHHNPSIHASLRPRSFLK